MRLSELIEYAKKKYNINEDKKVEYYFGFSVLQDSATKQWLAVLIKREDSDKNPMEYCDIKCGRDVILGKSISYIGSPFFMKGLEWVGVEFHDETQNDVVFSLLDKAVELNGKDRFTVTLESAGSTSKSRYENTPINFNDKDRKEDILESKIRDTRLSYSKDTEKSTLLSIEPNTQIKLKNDGDNIEKSALYYINMKDKSTPMPKYRDTALDFKSNPNNNFTPKKILEMRRLYKYGEYSFAQKIRNFYSQGKFMEDFEDDYEWDGEYYGYFATYNNLSLGQLRGYFSWRTKIRKGKYEKLNDSMAYIYVYELINGIGVTSVEESLCKMKEFDEKYIDDYAADRGMRRYLRRWMLALCVVNQVPPDIAMKYLDETMIKRDKALSILKTPQNHSDEEIFDALCLFYGSKLSSSTVIKKYEKDGKHLFAQVWRVAYEESMESGDNLLEECFGERHMYKWYPFSNAVYLERKKQTSEEYELNDCRKYVFFCGIWYEDTYHKLRFDRLKFNGLIHETDRRLRLYLKTGHPLTAKFENSWASSYVDFVIESDRKEKEELAKPKVSIYFDNLDKIRQDAKMTMDCLLSEEEKAAEEVILQEENIEKINVSQDEDKGNFANNYNLDSNDIQIIIRLLSNKAIDDLIAVNHGLPEIIADRINEAFFDEIGDNVVECDLGKITLIQEYKQDVEKIVKGAKNV